MLAKKERLPQAHFAKKPVATVRFLYGSIRKVGTETGIAVVVSKKVSRTAVKRNLIRRRFYSVLRPLVRSGALRGSYILYPNKEAIQASFGDVERALYSVFVGS